MSEESVDLVLVRRVQKGDKTAFDLLVLKYQHKVAKLVSRYIRDNDEIKDISQEAFIKAYRGLAQFRGDSAFYTWLYRIAINTAKSYLVSQGRRTTHQTMDIKETEQCNGAQALREQASPERELLTREIQNVVQTTIEQLPDELKMAITLREFEGISYEGIAVIMDCPIGTVRSRIFRARETINAHLYPLLSETDEGQEHQRKQI